MIKKIPIDQLRAGMYIHDLNCRWFDHSFLSNSFLVRDRATLGEVVKLGLRELFIDTEKGIDLGEVAPQPGVTAERQQSPQENAEKAAEKAVDKPVAVDLKNEAVRARRLHGEANKVVREALNDIRFGQKIQMERVESVIDSMIESISRNQNALLPIARLKNLDDYTFQHSVGVSALLIVFGRVMNLSKDAIKEIALGGLLHDIGKIQIPESILNKPGKLTDAEFVRVQSHVNEGLRLLKSVHGISPTILQVVAEHHERLDGSGYPNKLAGKAISLYGQMAGIVDVYDAITSEKVYSRGMPATQALKKLLEWSKLQFDPQLVQTFIRAVGIYPTGSLVRLESSRMGVIIEQNEGKLLEPVVRVFFHAGSQHYIPPEIVDLSKMQDRVASIESYEKWKIDPYQWLPV